MKNIVIAMGVIGAIGAPVFAEAAGYFFATCNAGPINPVNSNWCFPEGNLHAENGYDKALACATNDARTQCRVGGFDDPRCEVVGVVNHGFIVGGYASRGTGSCRVQVIVRGAD